MCREYLEKSRETVPDSEYMFPSPKGEGPHDRKWLSETFRDLWNASKPITNTEEVTVYRLRHRFATAVFMKWLNEGVNLNAYVPYLSAYVGYTDFESSAYYIHLLPKNLLESASVDWEKLNSLIPEVEHED